MSFEAEEEKTNALQGNELGYIEEAKPESASQLGGPSVLTGLRRNFLETEKWYQNLISNARAAYNQAKMEAEPLLTKATELRQQGIPAVSFSGPGGMGIKINSDGTVSYERGSEMQGYLDKIWSGLNTDERAYAELLAQVAPGYGKLSKQLTETLQGQRRGALSDLRSQMAQRRVLGASFADQQMESLALEYDNQIKTAQAEALVQELEMTGKVITARTASRMTSISAGMSELQFEAGVGANLLNQAENAMMQIKAMEVDLFKTAQTMKYGGEMSYAAALTGAESQMMGTSWDYAKTSAALDAQLKMAAADIYAQFGQTGAQSFMQAAEIGAQERAAAMAANAQVMSAGIGAIGSIFSDRRLKTDIEEVGVLYGGTKVYRYRFIDDPTTMYIGLMADEVVPEAVSYTPDGFALVNYEVATNASVRGAS